MGWDEIGIYKMVDWIGMDWIGLDWPGQQAKGHWYGTD
jgi:hypothetical protein